MAKQQQQPQQQPEQPQSPIADQFSDDEMAQVQRYGQAMSSPSDFSDEVEKALVKRGAYQKAQAQFHEKNAAKMRAAQTGGSPGLGPTEAEQSLAKQQQTLQQQAATTGAVSAQQAQAGEPAQPTPPPAPAGAAGVTKPYSTQAGAVGGAGEAPPGTQDQQQGSGGGGPPEAPGGEQGS
jgi:hypothetical protein